MSKTKKQLQDEIETLWGIVTHEVAEREKLAASHKRLAAKVHRLATAGDAE